ncbi:MAG: pyruvate ferredoxin oxidoreductase, partial [Gammaproteobacteria bacterium]|nr:pyruvate ferredoxin oxidoreductase [Gammaproteobacteria bacterium]
AAVDATFVNDAAGNYGIAETDDTLEQIMTRRERHLTDYQDEALAQRYRKLVEQVRQAESAIDPAAAALSEAVARGYFKLLAYKDEYEVARLHSRTGLREKIAAEFEGDYKLNFHMAPPLISRERDARGRPRKKRFGPWMMPVFRMLAGLRGLRGTPFDIFGYSAERRMERELITDYEDIVRRLLGRLDASNLDEAAGIASLVMDIRGFGPVKEQAAAKIRPEMAYRLDKFERGGGATTTPVDQAARLTS